MSVAVCETVQGESVIAGWNGSPAEFWPHWNGAWSPYWIGTWDLWNGMKTGPQGLTGHLPAWLP